MMCSLYLECEVVYLDPVAPSPGQDPQAFADHVHGIMQAELRRISVRTADSRGSAGAHDQ